MTTGELRLLATTAPPFTLLKSLRFNCRGLHVGVLNTPIMRGHNPFSKHPIQRALPQQRPPFMAKSPL